MRTVLIPIQVDLTSSISYTSLLHANRTWQRIATFALLGFLTSLSLGHALTQMELAVIADVILKILGI